MGTFLQLLQLFVPYSQQNEDNMNALIIASAGGGAFLVVVLVVTVAVCVRKRKAKTSRGEDIQTDENHTYGTYARGYDGEGEYGDGDIVEVVDNNDYYGGVGGAEVRDTNEYYAG